MQKNIVILGSTGSIGINVLNVIDQYPKNFKVIGLTAYNNIDLLKKQIVQYKPQYIAIKEEFRGVFKKAFPKLKLLDVETDLENLVTIKEVDIVVIAMRGSAALKPFLSAVKSGKVVAPANKEALVIAGEIIMQEAKKNGATVIPVDSEQSAIFQCLRGEKREQLRKVLLTASGGPLLNVAVKKFDKLTVKDILAHPRWKMGKKITVDSATLMNKGFEYIEAMRLFDLDAKEIEVIVHPEAIIHSMVEYCDGSVMAQMAVTDMRLPIQFALTYPDRWNGHLKSLDLLSLQKLSFYKPDLNKFPALKLCQHVVQKGGTYPAVLNAADELAVEAFLSNHISFTGIYDIVEKVVLTHRSTVVKPILSEILKADEWAREQTRKVITK